MWKKTKKNQWELAERATQEEKELIVAEVEHFEKCCEPTEVCPSPSVWCCKKCPPVIDRERQRLLREKYKELDDDFDDVLEPKKCFSIAGCPMCWRSIAFIAVALLLLYVVLR